MAEGQGAGYAATDGAAYERFIGRWTRRLADALVGFAGLPDGPVLDVGCGTGSVVAALRAANPDREITGIDIAEPYLAFARQRADCTNARFLQQDAVALDLPDAGFAGAVSCIVLNFLKDAPKALAEMRRVTRPGGVIASAVWDFRGGLVYQRLLWDTVAAIDPVGAATRDRIFSTPLGLPDGMLDLWRATGLMDVRRESLTIRMDFADFADYWEPLLGGQGPVGSYVVALAPEKRDEVQGAVCAAYLSGAPDGPRSLTATAWAVRGIVP
jgi:SAM-dependent methyltransferase